MRSRPGRYHVAWAKLCWVFHLEAVHVDRGYAGDQRCKILGLYENAAFPELGLIIGAETEEVMAPSVESAPSLLPVEGKVCLSVYCSTTTADHTFRTRSARFSKPVTYTV
jgi:hypothetical protein